MIDGYQEVTRDEALKLIKEHGKIVTQIPIRVTKKGKITHEKVELHAGFIECLVGSRRAGPATHEFVYALGDEGPIVCRRDVWDKK